MNQALTTAKQFVVKHSNAILTGTGIALMIGAVTITVPVTIKAKQVVEERKQEAEEAQKPFTKKDVVKETWKYYALPTALVILSGSCFVAAHKLDAKKAGQILSALSLSENAYQKLKSSVKEAVGEEKMAEITNKMHSDEVKNLPSNGKEIALVEGDGTLFLEPTSQRLFKSDINDVKTAINRLNERMFDECYITLNDLYDALGLNTTTIGDYLGWDINSEGTIQVNFEPHLDSKDRQILYIYFDNAPMYHKSF